MAANAGVAQLENKTDAHCQRSSHRLYHISVWQKGRGLKLRNALLCAQFVVTTLDASLNNEGPLISTLISVFCFY